VALDSSMARMPCPGLATFFCRPPWQCLKTEPI